MSFKSTTSYVAPRVLVIEMAPDDAMLLETSSDGYIDDMDKGEYIW